MLEKVPTKIVEWVRANMAVADSGCWVWSKYVGEEDRPLGRMNGRSVGVRRVIVASFVDPESTRKWVPHRRCETHGCVHPDHLYAKLIPTAAEARAVINKRRAAWRAANPEAFREQRKRDAASETTIATRRRWFEANSARHRQTVKKWLAIEENRLRVLEQQRKWKAANKEKVSAVLKSWRARNPEAVGDLKAKRRAAQMQRMPAWLDKFQRAAIRAIYAESRKLSESTGVRHTVDHMCPLQGDAVSGLHVPWNLRVVTRADNSKKHNNLVEALCMPAFI